MVYGRPVLACGTIRTRHCASPGPAQGVSQNGDRHLEDSEPVPILGAWWSRLAERAGFEPAVRFDPHTAFPVPHNRPLGHLSVNLHSHSSRNECTSTLVNLRAPTS